MVTPLLRMPASREARQLYISQMRSIYGSGIIEIPDPDYGLSQDPYIYAKVSRDPVIFAALQQRYHSVSGNEWHMEPPSDSPENKAAASIFEELFGHVSKFDQALYELATGILKGRTYAYLVGKRKRQSIDGGPMQEWFDPLMLRDIDKRRFRWVPEREQDGPSHRRIGQRLQYWSLEHLENMGWVDVSPEARRALVCFVYQDREERLGMGEGYITPLYHFFWAKSQIWQEYMQGISRWAQGFIDLAIDLDRPGSTSKTNDDLVDTALDNIDKMRGRHAMVHSKDDEVQIHETSGSGSNLCADALDKIDNAILRLLTGSVRPMGGDTETGARAQGEVEQDTSDVLIAYDRKLLAACITDHAVRCVWYQNRPQLIAQGLGKAQMPRFVISQETQEDPQGVATQVETLLRSGVELSKAEVYERTGWRMPTKDEAVFKAPEQPQQGGIPFPGGE